MTTAVDSGANTGNVAGVLVPDVDGLTRPALATVGIDATGKATDEPLADAGHIEVALPFGSLSSTSYALLASNTEEIVAFIVWNTTDVAITLSFDGGATDLIEVPANGAGGVDYLANRRRGPSGAIHYKSASAPTEGRLSFTAVT